MFTRQHSSTSAADSASSRRALPVRARYMSSVPDSPVGLHKKKTQKKSSTSRASSPTPELARVVSQATNLASPSMATTSAPWDAETSSGTPSTPASSPSKSTTTSPGTSEASESKQNATSTQARIVEERQEHLNKVKAKLCSQRDMIVELRKLVNELQDDKIDLLENNVALTKENEHLRNKNEDLRERIRDLLEDDDEGEFDDDDSLMSNDEIILDSDEEDGTSDYRDACDFDFDMNEHCDSDSDSDDDDDWLPSSRTALTVPEEADDELPDRPGMDRWRVWTKETGTLEFYQPEPAEEGDTRTAFARVNHVELEGPRFSEVIDEEDEVIQEERCPTVDSETKSSGSKRRSREEDNDMASIRIVAKRSKSA